MFGRATEPSVHHRYADIVKPGVQFVQANITAIDPAAKRVETEAGTFDADILVIALGADLDPGATPGLVEGRPRVLHRAGCVRLPRRARGIRRWTGDRRRDLDAVQVPARSERDRLAHARLPQRARAPRPVRDRSRHAAAACRYRRRPTRRRRCSPRSPSAASAGIPSTLVRGLDPARRVALLGDDTEMPYDLFLGVPEAPGAAAVVESRA